MIHVPRLAAEFTAAGLPTNSVGVVGAAGMTAGRLSYHERGDGVVRVEWQGVPDASRLAAAAAVVQAHDGSTAATAAHENVQNRALAAQALNSPGGDEKLVRAVLLVLLDELNLHAAKHNAILTAIDNGANLAGVKANIAAIADYPTRTAAQVRQAILDKLSAGDADS